MDFSIRHVLRKTLTADLEKLAEKFPTVGEGSHIEQAATILLQALDTLERQLNQPDLIRRIYVSSGRAGEMLPEEMCSIARRFCAGKITLERAEIEIIELKGHYEALFAEIGIKPSSTVMAIGL